MDMSSTSIIIILLQKRTHEIRLLKGRRFDTEGFARERVNELHAMLITLKSNVVRYVAMMDNLNNYYAWLQFFV